MSHIPVDRSYRALLRVPDMGRILLSMQIARVAQSMTGVAFVLFTLQPFDWPALAGLVTFARVFPGLAVSPIAGALLDRRRSGAAGRPRLRGRAVTIDHIRPSGVYMT